MVPSWVASRFVLNDVEIIQKIGVSAIRQAIASAK